MNKEYLEAFAEVEQLLAIFPQEILQKIPKTFKEFISKNKSDTFKVESIDGIFINDEKLKSETKLILAYIYERYLQDNTKEQVYTAMTEDDYKNMFKNKKTNEVKSEELTVLNQKWYSKFIQLIKKYFNKNNKSGY